MSRFFAFNEPFFKADGTVNALGTIYFANPNTDPFDQTNNAKAPYINRNLSTTTDSQIQLTLGGKLPNRLFLSGAYAIGMRDSGGDQVFNEQYYVGESTDTITDDSDYAGASLTATLNTIKTAIDAKSNNAIIDLVYPVGVIIELHVSTDPATLFSRGTWVKHGEGRVSVCQGSGNDGTDTVAFSAAGDTGGKYNHTLTTAQIPGHTHAFRNFYFREAAATVVAATDKETAPVGHNNDIGSGDTDTNNDTFLYLDDTTESTGTGNNHNITQPYIVVYRWRRTA